jgi:hypothetical protein
MITRTLIVWGGTGHAKVLHEAISSSPIRIVAIVDNRSIGSPIAGVPLLHGAIGLDRWQARRRSPPNRTGFAIAVGGRHGLDRIRLFKIMSDKGYLPYSVIHPASYVAVDAILGEGCQILAGAVIATHAHIDHGAIVNTAASVDHDCRVGHCAHIGPGA